MPPPYVFIVLLEMIELFIKMSTLLILSVPW